MQNSDLSLFFGGGVGEGRGVRLYLADQHMPYCAVQKDALSFCLFPCILFSSGRFANQLHINHDHDSL